MPKTITTDEEAIEETKAKVRLKKIKNISPNKREIDIMGNSYVLQPNQVIEIPEEFIVPRGIGIHVIK